MAHLYSPRPYAVAVLLALLGCGTTTRHGDAVLHTERPTMGPAGHRTWRLELPEVLLTEAGTHVFHVRGIPAIPLGYDVLMLVPEARRGEQDISNAPWRDARLTLTVRSTGGTALGGSTYRLGDLFAGNGFGAGQYEALPEVTRAAPVGRDYDVEVRVDRPSPRRGDRARVRASATTNDSER